MISRKNDTTVISYEDRGYKKQLGHVWKGRHRKHSVSIVANKEFEVTSV